MKNVLELEHHRRLAVLSVRLYIIRSSANDIDDDENGIPTAHFLNLIVEIQKFGRIRITKFEH